MKNFKLLVVDDDLPILHALRDFQWESCGCQLVGAAQNGQEALEKCREFKPDIVVTDIVMPIMDGLEFIKVLKSWIPHLQIIIITSYRDFEYAKEAIHLGVKEYLIKGVYTDEELCQAIERAKDEFNKEAINLKFKNESDIIMKNEALVNLLVNEDFAENKDAQVLIKFPARFVMLHLVWNITPGLLSEKKVSELLFSYKSSYIHEIIFISSHEIHLLYKDIGINLVINDIEDLMAEVEAAFNSSGIKYFVSVDDVITSFKQYKYAVKKNQNALRKKFYYNKSQFFISEVKFRPLLKEEKQKVNQSIKRNTSIEEIEEYLRNEFLDYMMSENIDPEDVKLLFYGWISEIYSKNTVKYDNPFTEEYGHMMFISELIDKYISLYSSINLSISSGERYEISKALQIINDNLTSNLTADSIAEEIGLSPNYFGYIFKNYMGQNFKEYLTKVRMEKALYLIKNTNYKIYEVAEQVGIPNYRYFVSVFEKYYNKSPSDVKGGR